MLIRNQLARLATRLPTIVPPEEFACRIERLTAGSASIDNDLYSDAAHVATWHSEDTSRQLATLQLLNAARIPYFDRVWRQQLELGPSREGSFLEIGCGGGIATGALATLGYNMTGVDPAAASLEAAREHAGRLGLHERMHFLRGDACDLSMFPRESFDGVLLADVLEHLYDLPKAVAQAWRVLRPGGVLAFDTINRTFASYVLTIALAQEGLRIVPPRTHDWRLYIKPHELTYLLQVCAHRSPCVPQLPLSTRTTLDAPMAPRARSGPRLSDRLGAISRDGAHLRAAQPPRGCGRPRCGPARRRAAAAATRRLCGGELTRSQLPRRGREAFARRPRRGCGWLRAADLCTG